MCTGGFLVVLTNYCCGGNGVFGVRLLFASIQTTVPIIPTPTSPKVSQFCEFMRNITSNATIQTLAIPTTFDQ